MKKVIKTILITSSILAFVPLVFLGGMGLSHSIHKKKNIEKINKKTLSKSKVVNNFSVGGIWENKKYLSHDDLGDYEYIENDAFDNLSKKLEYVELNNDITINYSNENFIKWENVDEIKVFNRSAQSNLKSFGNVLYSKSGLYRYETVSITNRKENCNITFPTQSDLEFSGYKIGIINNFYNIFNFKNNINKISFGDSKYITSIKAIGDNAFKNCSVLENELSLSIGSNILIIGNESFMNTNITKLSIKGEVLFSILEFEKNAFKGSSNLSKIDLLGLGLVTFGESSFSNLNKSLNFNLVGNTRTLMGNNIFSNSYSDFMFNYISVINDNAFHDEYSSKTFDQINVSDINKFQFNINRKKDEFNNLGLTSEQYAKIKVVDTNIPY